MEQLRGASGAGMGQQEQEVAAMAMTIHHGCDGPFPKSYLHLVQNHSENL